MIVNTVHELRQYIFSLKSAWDQTFTFEDPVALLIISGASYNDGIITYICYDRINMITSTGPSITLLAASKGDDRLTSKIKVIKKGKLAMDVG